MFAQNLGHFLFDNENAGFLKTGSKLFFNYENLIPISDVYFWLDRTELPTKEGLKVPSPEYGVAPLQKYENARVVLVLPGLHKVTSFKSFSLYCLNYDVSWTKHMQIDSDSFEISA